MGIPQFFIYPGCSSDCLPFSTWSFKLSLFHSVIYCSFHFFHAVFETMSSTYSCFKILHTPCYIDWISTYPCYSFFGFLFVTPVVVIPHFKPYSNQIVIANV